MRFVSPVALASFIACANFAVPERAIVPRDESISSRLMPTPVSSIVIVFAARSVCTWEALSTSFFKIKTKMLFGYFDPENIFLDNENNRFLGDLTDVSVKKEARMRAGWGVVTTTSPLHVLSPKIKHYQKKWEQCQDQSMHLRIPYSAANYTYSLTPGTRSTNEIQYAESPYRSLLLNQQGGEKASQIMSVPNW